jgi:hypothetical protein
VIQVTETVWLTMARQVRWKLKMMRAKRRHIADECWRFNMLCPPPRVCWLTLALLLLSGCALRKPVRSYQSWATRTCEQHHTVEECRPLNYPSCQTGLTGRECRR